MTDSIAFAQMDMTTSPQRLLAILDEVMAHSSAIHQSMLEQQAAALAALDKIRGAAARVASPVQTFLSEVVFSRRQLESFASGLVADCFGPAYAELDKRKTPRIPNGRLLLIDRVLAISGLRGQPKPPAAITSQVDVPVDAWYSEGSYPQIPLAILMEMALQPCGILSAYLGTALVIPPENNLFRNLDGTLRCSALPDLRGKTITNQVAMTRAVASGGLYIQTYSFALSVDGTAFLSGESSFGYFTEATMARQSGLDGGGQARAMLLKTQQADSHFQLLCDNAANQQKGLLDLADCSWFDPQGGRYQRGVLAGIKNIKGDEWFFSNHFYQDPVMPGSLGVEMITRALWDFLRREFPQIDPAAYSLQFGAADDLRWKYRGQVLPTNQEAYFEVHIKEIERSGQLPIMRADADFWVDGLRIYSVENLSIELKESRIQ